MNQYSVPDAREAALERMNEWYAQVQEAITQAEDLSMGMLFLMMCDAHNHDAADDFDSCRSELAHMLDKVSARWVAAHPPEDDGRRFWYFSFASDRAFLYGCIIEADDKDEAFVRCHELDLYTDLGYEPACVGPVMGIDLYSYMPEEKIETKLTKEDIDAMPGGGVTRERWVSE